MTGGTLSRMSSSIASAIGKSRLDNFSRWSQGTDHLFCLPKIHLQKSTKFASFLHHHRIPQNNTGNKIFRINAKNDCLAANVKVSSHMVILIPVSTDHYKIKIHYLIQRVSQLAFHFFNHPPHITQMTLCN